MSAARLIRLEELFVYSLLCLIGYDKYDEYKEALDHHFLSDPSNADLLDLEMRNYKDAIIHTLSLFEKIAINTDGFGSFLMDTLKPIYSDSCIEEFADKMYKLWCNIPFELQTTDPFHILSYADDCLSLGDEKQCRELYEKALYYYEQQ